MIKNFCFLFFACLISMSFVSATDIAYILKDVNAPEQNILNAITETGYTYELIDDSKIPSTNFSNYGMILVWDEVLSNYEKIPVTKTRSLVGVGRSSYIDDWGIADYVNNLGSNNYESGIILVKNEITEGLETNIQLYNNINAKIYVLPLSYKNRASGLQQIVSTPYDRAVIGEIELGGGLYGGGKAEARTVFFGITETEFWTQESKILFKNSLKWLIKEDNDGDGFFDDDCDDSNPEINPDAEELIDDIDQNCVNDEPVLTRELNSIAWTAGNTRQIYLEDYFADPDGDSLKFSVYESSGNANINININNGLVIFTSAEGWTGEDWVIFRAEDSNGGERLSDKITLRVLSKNSAPIINDYSPKGSVRILKNADKQFSISVSDAEGFVDILWFLDGAEVESGNTYMFNQEKGTYSLEAYVSDGEYDTSKIWNVFVGDISELTCEQVNGYTCSNNEYCMLDNILKVSDTNNCCSAVCSPKFENLERCEISNPEIEIQIQDIVENEKFKIGETINGRLRIKNTLGDLDFDVGVYLYNLGKDEEIDRYETSVSLDKDREKTLSFEFEIPEDLDEENDYVIFAKVIEEDEKYCNENYIKIEIVREEHDGIIKNFDFGGNVVCGDSIYIQTKIKNIGKNDEKIYLVIENSELEIYEETEEFDLEINNEAEKKFEVKIPENTEAGNYEIEFAVFFGSEKNFISKKLFVECDWVEEVPEPEESLEEKTSINKTFIFLLIILFVLVISLLGFYTYNSNALKNFKVGALNHFDKLKSFNVSKIKDLKRNKPKKSKRFKAKKAD